MARQFKAAPAAAATALALSVAACGHNPMSTYSWGARHYANLSERDCMARAMYFESNRSSQEGMKAVGTVVMNRLKSGQYGNNLCGIVGAPRQFAPGVLSKPVSGPSWALAQRSADAVLAGERHARVGRAMHFHTAGYTFPYRNMAYVVAAGGNVFYEKKTPGTFNPIHPNVFVAEARQRPERPSERIVLARAEAEAPRAEPVRLARSEEREPPGVVQHVTPPRLARQDEAAPRQRTEPVRVAALDERPAARGRADRMSLSRADDDRIGTRVGHGRRQLAERNENGPRERPKPERIRLAHLEDETLPRALRQKSDASPLGVLLPSKPKPAGAEPSRTSRAVDSRKPGTLSVAPSTSVRIARSEPAPMKGARSEPARVMAATGTSKGKPASGQVLPYRDARATPRAGADPAKLGWKRGPDPKATGPDISSKRR